MITYEYDLDMTHGGLPLEFGLKQYDADFTLVFNLFSRKGTLNITSGTTVKVRGTKPDGHGYSVDASLSGTTVTVTGDQQMTAAAGHAPFELSLLKNGKELNTTTFIIHVERAALDLDTVSSESKIREIVEITERTDEIIAAANLANAACETTAANKNAAEAAAAQTAEDLAAVNQKAADIARITTDADTIARQALEKAGNAENETAEFENRVDSVEKKQRQLELKSEGYCEELEVDNNGLVYLLNNGERIAGPYGPFAGGGGGGGGEGGNNAELTVTNASGWLSKTIAAGDSCPISITWSSIEDNLPTGDGTMRITVNGIVKAILNIQQGTVTTDLARYLATGSNVVKVNIADVYDNNRTINFSITSIALSISSSFDATVPHQGAISFPYTPVGSVQKTIHFLLDGREIGNTTTSVSGRQMSYTITQQSHGAHTFECYFDCDINGQLVESNHLYYEIICLEPLNNTPIIVSSFNETEVKQYTTMHVDYTVYNPASLTAETTIYVNNTQVSKLTVDRTQQVFTYRADDTGTLTIRIESGGVTKTITTTITESDINVEAETEALSLYLASAGRSNREENPATWVYENYEAVMTGFNFSSDGWLNDEQGVTVLRVSGDARVQIPYKAFETDFRGTGKTIEIEFATRDVMNYDSTILSCLSGGRGINVTAQKATMASEQSEISM